MSQRSKTEYFEIMGDDPGLSGNRFGGAFGQAASGIYLFSLNLTDIFSGWVETRAVMGKGERGVVAALTEMFAHLPFPVKGIDSDNGSEFINAHLKRFCDARAIQFTHGRPYKKDDNAHIEQKNWTHVRKVMGWERYDSQWALEAMNAFYAGPWRTMMNLFQPCVKLQKKVRHGLRLKRQYDSSRTPLDRLQLCRPSPSASASTLQVQRAACDPSMLSKQIERQLEAIWKMANPHYSPGT